MRVAIVNRHRADGVGGSEVQCDIIARGLTERGHDVVYVAVDGAGPYDEVPYRVEPIHADAAAIAGACADADVVYWRLNRQFLRKAARLIARAQVPLVFAVSNDSDLVRVRRDLMAHRGSVRMVLQRIREVARLAWEHGGLAHVDAVVCQTEEQARRAGRWRAVTIPNSLHREAPVPFDWPSPYVAWVGNLKPRKRPDVCLRLADALASHGVDVLVAGVVQHRAYAWFEDRTRLPANLHYLGARPLAEVSGLIGGSLALVNTSARGTEGFPNTFIQAWDASTPVVTLVEDPDGLIARRELGLAAGDDLDAFVRDVVRLARDPATRDRLGSGARSFAREHLDPERNVERLEAFLDEVVAGMATEVPRR